MTTGFDPHERPQNLLLNNRTRRAERDLSELLGLAKGMLADGVVNAEEARYLNDWGANHLDALERWPLSLIFARLRQHFADGQIDEAERVALHGLLSHLVDGTTSLLLGSEGATLLPLDEPAPPVLWGPDHVYVFAGEFAYGTHEDCERETIRRGSSCQRTVTEHTSFLVIGTFGSEDWRHSVLGHRILEAKELRAVGCPIRIVGEDHWVKAVGPRPVEEPPF